VAYGTDDQNIDPSKALGELVLFDSGRVSVPGRYEGRFTGKALKEATLALLKAFAPHGEQITIRLMEQNGTGANITSFNDLVAIEKDQVLKVWDARQPKYVIPMGSASGTGHRRWELNLISDNLPLSL
jgi:hypothetical protein